MPMTDRRVNKPTGRDRNAAPECVRPFALFFVVLVFGLSACADRSEAVADGTDDPAVSAEVETEPVEVRAEAGEAGEHAESSERDEHAEGREAGEHEGEGGEHDGESGEHDEGGEGEESGVYIAADETWDAVRRGARLVLAYDAAADAFVGAVENTTGDTLCAVRVEVHLAGGTELGPTERTDVPAGETTQIRLPAEGHTFESWTAHPELSACSG